MSEFIRPYIANISLVSCDQNLFSIQGWKLKETSVDVLLLEIVLSCNSRVGDKSDLVVTLYGQHPGIFDPQGAQFNSKNCPPMTKADIVSICYGNIDLII